MIKYSPEWFREEAQKPEYRALDEKNDKLRKQFNEQYGVDWLKGLSGKKLLTGIFYNDEDNSHCLCHELEMNKELRDAFGSILGGSAYKFGLFYHKKTHEWTSGSPTKPVVLSEDKAIVEAGRIRDDLVEGADILSDAGSFDSEDDYKKLYAKLEHIPEIGSVWVLKYYQMLFPEILPTYYARNAQTEVLKFLKKPVSDIPFLRMGSISLFLRECGITSPVFGAIYSKTPEYSKYKSATSYVDALSDVNSEKTRYWLYSPGEGARKWEEFYSAGIMGIGWYEIGDLSRYNSREEIRAVLKATGDIGTSYKFASLATWQFLTEMKPGDVVFAKKGRSTVIGRGVVESDYYYDSEIDSEYPNIRKVKWTNKGEWEHPGAAVMKTLTDITQYTDYVEKLCALFDPDADEEDEPEIIYPAYSQDDFLSDVFMDQEDYDTLVEVLKTKKNLILQGAPGVGKTFAAKRLAYSIIGEKNPDRVQMIQFHQSYSYEDFIEGYRPSDNGFVIKKGSFYKFCKKAADDKENDYFFIIDEINRGNLSRIFGELFMLIEMDKRGIELQLLYSDEKFSVPENLYLIGMMNTADRSLAMLDYALRRRFSFFDMKPGFDTAGFIEYQDSLHNLKFNSLINCVRQLNKTITEDAILGEGFCVGHSYFCNLDAETVNDHALRNIVEFELIPLLKEYWFDDKDKVDEWTLKLRGAIK